MGLAGCDLLIPDPEQNTVTVEIDASEGSQVLHIVSQDFTVAVDQDGQEFFNLLESDTTWVTTPFEGSYVVEPSDAGIGGFYSQAAASENPEATVSMRVLVDGEESYYDETVLTGDGLRFYFRRY